MPDFWGLFRTFSKWLRAAGGSSGSYCFGNSAHPVWWCSLWPLGPTLGSDWASACGKLPAAATAPSLPFPTAACSRTTSRLPVTLAAQSPAPAARPNSIIIGAPPRRAPQQQPTTVNKCQITGGTNLGLRYKLAPDIMGEPCARSSSGYVLCPLRSQMLRRNQPASTNALFLAATITASSFKIARQSLKMVPVKPKAGELLEPKLQPDGSVAWQQFVKVIGPIDIRAIACGDNVSDLIIAPWPSGMSSWSDLTGIPKNCIGKQANQAPSGVSGHSSTH